jgi:hypothetical protein
MRSDPTDNGGLFIGRRPGTAPIRYKAAPTRGDRRRRRFDQLLAASILFLMGLVAVMFWGPIPAAWLWVCGRINYWTGSILGAITVAFVGMLLTLIAGLAVMKRLDHFWILVRRAAGHDQKSGVIGPVFGIASIVGVTLFTLWLLLIAGLGPSFAPTQ